MATIALDGTANGLIKYTGSYTDYAVLANLGKFAPVGTAKVAIMTGSLYSEWEFDSEAQRDAAITTLKGYF